MNWIKNNMNQLFISSAIALLCAITFFFFGPLEIILSSPSEFWFSATDVLPIVVVATIVCFVLIFIIQVCSYKLSEKLGKLISGVFAGVGLAVYIQGNWTFVNYGIMDGTPIDWTSFGIYPLVNTLLWCAIIGVISVLFVFKWKFAKIYAGIAVGIVAMQLLTLGTVAMFSLTDVERQKNEFVITTEGQFELSKDKHNILVILADGFDGSDFLPALKAEPELESYFDGFTFYEDTCGTSLYSEESAITILTGNQFEVGPSFKENVDKAYGNSFLYQTLDKFDYKTSLYLSDNKMLSYKLIDQIVNVKQGELRLDSWLDTFDNVYTMTAFRYMPHALKAVFWYTSMDFSELKTEESYSDSNVKMKNYLDTMGVTSTADTNVYQFFWIQGPHEPVVMDRYCQPLERHVQMSDERYSEMQFEQTIGVVRLFTDIITELKDKNVYDNTTIIFTADHGWDLRPNPLLLIKMENTRGNLEVSTVPVSMIEDYMPTVLSIIDENGDYGNTIFDLTEDIQRSRPFYIYDINSSDRTYNNLDIVHFHQGLFKRHVVLGEDISPFQMSLLSEFGLSSAETTHVWSDGKETKMIMELSEIPTKDLKITFNLRWVYNGTQKIKIYANDVLCFNDEKSDAKSFSIIVPYEVTNKKERLELLFEFSDAVSPASLGESSDSRELALAFTSMIIEEVE